MQLLPAFFVGRTPSAYGRRQHRRENVSFLRLFWEKGAFPREAVGVFSPCFFGGPGLPGRTGERRHGEGTRRNNDEMRRFCFCPAQDGAERFCAPSEMTWRPAFSCCRRVMTSGEDWSAFGVPFPAFAGIPRHSAFSFVRPSEASGCRVWQTRSACSGENGIKEGRRSGKNGGPYPVGWRTTGTCWGWPRKRGRASAVLRRSARR